MSSKARIGNTWESVTDIYARVGGSWKEVAEGYAKVNGNWEQFFASIAPLVVQYLVIAGGGGGGGSHAGGGGGAGGYRSSVTGENSGGGANAETALTLATATNYTITVGAGGSAGSNTTQSTAGNNSVFGSVTSSGGGRGGQENAFPGGAGGSGGGGSGDTLAANRPAGSGTTNQGSGGGTGTNNVANNYGLGGGGGGASTSGANAATTGGNGGNGVSSQITSLTITRAGGGGGGGWGPLSRSGGSGGSGGGGAGSSSSGVAGTAGTANTGGGGGGSNADGAPRAGGAGGSGIVILRYPASYTIGGGSGLTFSTTTVGSNKVTTFTAGTGNIAFFENDSVPQYEYLPGLAGKFFNGEWRATISTGNIGTLPLTTTNDSSNVTGTGGLPTAGHRFGVNRWESISYTTLGESYGFIAIGYFTPPTTGTYTFFTSSDDGSGVWIGEIASADSGRTTSNAVVNNGLGFGQGDTKRSGSIALTAGVSYPIRIVHEEGFGGDNLTFSWSGPGISETTNLAQYFTTPVFFGTSTLVGNYV